MESTAKKCPKCGTSLSECERICPNCDYVWDYLEILQNQSWKDRRIQILQRDNFQCSACKNESIIINSQFGIRPSVEPIGKAQLNNIINGRPVFTSKFLIKFQTAQGDEASANVYAYSNLKSEDIRWRMVYFVKEEDKYVINLIRTNTKGKIVDSYVRDLNVHHKYYQDRLCPWEYPDNALVTFCWRCHTEFHANEKVPYYDEVGHKKVSIDEFGNKEELFLTPCSRCFGSGYLPQYQHVENGVCFRCMGAKYEEFIGETAVFFDMNQKNEKSIRNSEPPFELEPICPEGHSDNIVKIVYGYPLEALIKKSIEGKVMLGGCIVSDNSPKWYCKTHDIKF